MTPDEVQAWLENYAREHDEALREAAALRQQVLDLIALRDAENDPRPRHGGLDAAEGLEPGEDEPPA